MMRFLRSLVAAGIVADGTAGQITFTSAYPSPAPGNWNYIGFYDQSSSQCLLKHCRIEYGGGQSGWGMVYIDNTNKPLITNDSIGNSADWGVYLDGSVYPDSAAIRTHNTFYNNASGNIYRP